MLPFGIHFETIANRVPDVITPSSSRTFGWRRAFHVTNSLQNLCMSQSAHRNAVLRMGTWGPVTHMGNLSQVFACVYLQDLDRDLLSLIFAFLHIPKPTTIHWDSR